MMRVVAKTHCKDRYNKGIGKVWWKVGKLELHYSQSTKNSITYFQNNIEIILLKYKSMYWPKPLITNYYIYNYFKLLIKTYSILMIWFLPSLISSSITLNRELPCELICLFQACQKKKKYSKYLLNIC